MKITKIKYLLITILLLFTGIESFAQQENGNDDFTSALSGKKLLDDVSFIFDFSYIWRDLKSGDFEELSVPGAISISDTEIVKNGFNMNYAELAIPARIDKFFNMFVDMRIDTEDITLHELYADSTDLPASLNLKFGRFLSSFGRINRKHEHELVFGDIPIIYESMFGKKGLLENGVYLGWTVPVDFTFTLGCEILQGENKNSYGSEEVQGLTGNFNQPLEASDLPNLANLLIKNGFGSDAVDVEWGLSLGIGGSRLDKVNTDSSKWIFDGKTAMIGFDLLIRYNFDAYRNIALQGEFLHRTMSGDKITDFKTHYDVTRTLSGFYAQLTVRPLIHWRFGARFESIVKNSEKNSDISDSNLPTLQDCFKASAVIDYLTTQHTRFRLQYNYNNYQYDGAQTLIPNHEVIVQATASIGSHGKFLK